MIKEICTLLLSGLLLSGLAAQIIGDYTVWLAWLGYLPLPFIAVAALGWDLLWRGRSGLLVKPRFALSGLSIFSLIWVFMTLQGFATGQDGPHKTPQLTLLQWNIRWGGYHPKQDLPTIAQRILQYQPDIVVINEAPSSAIYQQRFQQALGQAYPAHAQAEPVMLLSRWPIHTEQTVSFQNGMGLIATVTTPTQTLRILVVDGVRDLTQPRALLLDSIAAFCEQAKQQAQPIDIIAGDFNALGRSRGFDAWTQLGYQLAAQVAGVWRGSWMAGLPLYDIDHVWLQAGFHGIQVAFFSDAVPDHRGQVVRFHLPDVSESSIITQQHRQGGFQINKHRPNG